MRGRACQKKAMTKAIPILLLLLTACGQSDDSEQGGGETGDAPAEAANLLAATAADPSAGLEERVKAAMSAALQKPDRARYGDLRPGATGSICGSVDPAPGAKGGGLRPFVVTPEGIAVISPTPQIMFDEPGDIFPDYYIRWCASPEELAQLGPRVNAGGRVFAPGADIPDLGPIELPPVPTGPEVAAAAEAPPAPPPEAPPPRAQPPAASDEDSFSKAVIRKGEQRTQ